MSISSREEFEKRLRMIRRVSGLDGDIPMTDASSTESTTSSTSFEPISNVQRLGRPIPQLPADLGVTNLRSSLFQQTAAVLTLISTFMNHKSQSELTITCKRALLFKPSLKEAAPIVAQHLVSGNFLKADALFQKTRDQDKKELLNCVVEVTNHRKRRIKQRLFEIAVMLGTRRANSQDIDLVESWGSYLPPEEAESRYQAVVLTTQERAAKRQPIVQAIRKLLQAIIQAQEQQPGADFEALKTVLAPAIEAYQNTFVPDPNEVLTSGYVFDAEIFCDFITLFEAHVHQLDGWWSIGSDVFDIVGFGTLQFNADLWDLQVLKCGIERTLEENKKPDRSLNVASPDCQFLSMVGSSRVLTIYGFGSEKCDARGWRGGFYTKLCSIKNSPAFTRKNWCVIL